MELKGAPTTQPAEVGEVPAHWTVGPLGNFVSRVTYGFTNPMPTTEEGPIMVTAKDIRGGRIDYTTTRHTSEDAYRASITDKSRPRVGDILLTKDGSIGRVAICDRRDVCVNQSVAVIQPIDSTDSRFIKYLLEAPHYQNRMEGDADGTTIKHIYITRVDKMQVAVPPLLEQRAIAHILGTLDDKIELNRKMSETLEAMARALFKSWFVDFDPVRAKMEGRDPGLPKEIADLFPSGMVESELGEVPEGWEVRPLGDLVEIVKGRSYKSEELTDSSTALVTLKSFSRGGGYRSDGLKPFAGTYKKEQVFEPGEVVVACTDVTQAADVIGRTAIVRPARLYKTLVASLDTMIVRPRARGLSRSFLYCLGRSEAFVAHTYSHTTGTTVLHMGKEAILSFMCIVPPRRLIEQFDSVAAATFSRLQTIDQESETVSALREGLLPKLISGALRVGD